MTRTVWIDGALVPAAQATVSAYDRAFRSGEGVFETFRAYGPFVFRMDAHLDRAIAGAEVLGFQLPPRDELARAVQAVVDDNACPSSAVRLVATPGDIDPDSPFPGTPTGTARVVVTVHDLVLNPTLASGVSAIVVPWGREIAHVKAVSYLASLLARRAAREQGAHEALLTDGNNVLEASGANVFAVIAGTLVTPPLDGSILAGVTRQVTIEVARERSIAVVERDLPLDELLAADEAFLTASTREIVPLVEVSGRSIGDGVPGPSTSLLREGFAALVAREAELPEG